MELCSSCNGIPDNGKMTLLQLPSETHNYLGISG